MSRIKYVHWLLLGILIIGSILRFWNVASQDSLQDEGFYGFRSIGYLDFINNDAQTTPIQWFKDASLPFWTKLSFHDHPPLFFLIQHWFFSLFGDSIFISRLPSILFGLGSIFIIYLLGKKIFKNQSAGLLASALLALNAIHVWISRSGIMESVLLFWILLNIYLFFEFLENQRKWFWFGLTLSLIFLTKYTGFFLIPVYLLYLLIYRRDLYIKKEIYLALATTLIFFSPVLIYNFYLWKTFGHFDLQFAYLLRQSTPEWRVSVGKIQEPFSQIFSNLIAMYSWPILVLFLAGLISSIWKWRKPRNPYLVFGWLATFFITLMLIAVGSAYRFLAFYAAPAIFFSVFFIGFLLERIPWRQWFIILLAIFLGYELYFTLDADFFTFPDFGINQLDRYLSQEIGGQRPLVSPKSPNPHLEAVIQSYKNNYPVQDKKIAIIYDENISLPQKLWLFDRRIYYHAIPALTVAQFKYFLKNNTPNDFKGYDFYFVKATQYTSLNPYFSTPDADLLETFLKNNLGISPAKIIYGSGNFPMLIVYKFSL